MKHQLKFAIVLLIGLLGYAGCHTMEGAGQDIQKGGQKLEGAAQDANH